ncbi:MAG: HD-GYP domain-containing protein [Candidatus Aminicenantes bacterium]|nr:HD-GYP domain-containing protein [Candidatus Aminicenantes bacterium]
MIYGERKGLSEAIIDKMHKKADNMNMEDESKDKILSEILDFRERHVDSAMNETRCRQAEETLIHVLDKLEKTMENVVYAMAKIVEMRDPYTASHQQRVSTLACTIARDMGLSEEQIDGINMAAVIHDIGKIGIPAEILSKPGRWTEYEYSMSKTHPKVGYEILKSIDFPWPIAQTVLQHHERMDGSGYPHGLSGEEILLEARILAVADVVEAMASHRPYRPSLGINRALEEISEKKGILYEARVVDSCLRILTKERSDKF